MSMNRISRTIFRKNVLLAISLSGVFVLLAGSAAVCESTEKSKTSTPSLKGKALFKSHNCSACHTINAAGGCLAPPLDGIAKRRNNAFITARITDNQAAVKRFQELYGQTELMPHPRVKEVEARQIAAYLLSLPSAALIAKGHQQNTSPPTATDASEISKSNLNEGKKLLAEAGCSACHSLGGLGGNLAPKFDNIGERLTMQAISEKVSRANFLIDGTDEYDKRGVSMPPSNLTADEVRKISAYLSSLTKH